MDMFHFSTYIFLMVFSEISAHLSPISTCKPCSDEAKALLFYMYVLLKFEMHGIEGFFPGYAL